MGAGVALEQIRRDRASPSASRAPRALRTRPDGNRAKRGRQPNERSEAGATDPQNAGSPPTNSGGFLRLWPPTTYPIPDGGSAGLWQGRAYSVHAHSASQSSGARPMVRNAAAARPNMMRARHQSKILGSRTTGLSSCLFIASHPLPNTEEGNEQSTSPWLGSRWLGALAGD